VLVEQLTGEQALCGGGRRGSEPGARSQETNLADPATQFLSRSRSLHCELRPRNSREPALPVFHRGHRATIEMHPFQHRFANGGPGRCNSARDAGFSRICWIRNLLFVSQSSSVFVGMSVACCRHDGNSAITELLRKQILSSAKSPQRPVLIRRVERLGPMWAK